MMSHSTSRTGQLGCPSRPCLVGLPATNEAVTMEGVFGWRRARVIVALVGAAFGVVVLLSLLPGAPYLPGGIQFIPFVLAFPCFGWAIIELSQAQSARRRSQPGLPAPPWRGPSGQRGPLAHRHGPHRPPSRDDRLLPPQTAEGPLQARHRPAVEALRRPRGLLLPTSQLRPWPGVWLTR